ncbi:GNAT family N-acetyltransferase [Aspergillus undulatus]|uniref:GNAT family N-acetyltransferase n=1 Tax=Aspergillus undulatus TaxID=1810928 RepID=UPI003CCE42B1
MSSSPIPPPILSLPKSNTQIRPFHNTLSEATTFSSHANSPLIARYMRNAFPQPYTHQDAHAWFTYTSTQTPLLDFAIADASSNTAIGAVGLKPRSDVQHRTVEIGYWIGQEYWGRGIGSEVVTAFTEWTFKEFPHVVRIEAGVFEGNEGSKRVLEKAGYGFEGRQRRAVEKNGVLLDVFVYAVVRDGV